MENSWGKPGKLFDFLKDYYCTQHVTRAWTRAVAIRCDLTLGFRFFMGLLLRKNARPSMSQDMREPSWTDLGFKANLFKRFSDSSISERLDFKLNCFPLFILLSQGTQAAVEESHGWVCGWYSSKVGRCYESSRGFDALKIVWGTSSQVCQYKHEIQVDLRQDIWWRPVTSKLFADVRELLRTVNAWWF